MIRMPSSASMAITQYPLTQGSTDGQSDGRYEFSVPEPFRRQPGRRVSAPTSGGRRRRLPTAQLVARRYLLANDFEEVVADAARRWTSASPAHAGPLPA